jgi:hypothetical protein
MTGIPAGEPDGAPEHVRRRLPTAEVINYRILLLETVRQ